jgi:mono/diheme cytochrome c family protein
MNPPLVGSAWVSGPGEALAGFVMTGGFTADRLMGRFDYLADDELAAILSYVRHEFGDGAPQVTPAQVARVRADLAELK